MAYKPRNVRNYMILPTPDSCQVCVNRNSGITKTVLNFVVLTCSLACRRPKKSIFCDQVDPTGVCDLFRRGDPESKK